MTWNTDLIETMELEHVMSQAAQDRYDGETLHDNEKLKLTNLTKCSGKHASRCDSQAQQYKLTSRGGVLVERVYEQRARDMSTTCTKHLQGLALCSRGHPAWASVASQWVPARTPTVHWAVTTGGRVLPDTNATNVKSRCNDASLKHSKTPVLRQTERP